MFMFLTKAHDRHTEMHFHCNFALHTGWHTACEFVVKIASANDNLLYICGKTKGHIVFQYHILWQNEQKKIGWIARVGQTAREGQTTRVDQVGWIHSFVQSGQHGLWTTGLLNLACLLSTISLLLTNCDSFYSC